MGVTQLVVVQVFNVADCHSVTLCNKLQHSTSHYSTVLQHTTTRCNALRHTLQHTACGTWLNYMLSRSSTLQMAGKKCTCECGRERESARETGRERVSENMLAHPGLVKQEHSWVTNCSHRALSYETRTLQSYLFRNKSTYESRTVVIELLATKHEPYKLSLEKQWTLCALWVIVYEWLSMSACLWVLVY